MSIFRKFKTKYRKGDRVTLKQQVTFGNGVSIPAGTEVEITFVDPLFRTYDIIYNGVDYTDFSDNDFITNKGE
jgi:hypothetical protein